jgi:hypothetical protein
LLEKIAALHLFLFVKDILLILDLKHYRSFAAFQRIVIFDMNQCIIIGNMDNILDEDNDLIMGNFYEFSDSFDHNTNLRRLRSSQSQKYG